MAFFAKESLSITHRLGGKMMAFFAKNPCRFSSTRNKTKDSIFRLEILVESCRLGRT